MIPGFFAAGATAGEVLWTPANLATQPRVWMDWDSAVTNVSGAASAWSNSKGSLGSEFNQANASRMPSILPAEIAGKRALRFDSQFLESSGMLSMMTNVSAAWLFCVYKKRGLGVGNNTLFAVKTGSGGGRFNSTVGDASSTRPTMNIRRLDADSSAALSSADGLVGNWMLRFDQMNYASGAADIFLNGVNTASSASLTTSGNTTNTASSTPAIIGAFTASITSNPADMDLALLIVGAGSLPSTDERQKLEGWAAWQLGLEANLPAAHPYKSSPPAT